MKKEDKKKIEIAALLAFNIANYPEKEAEKLAKIIVKSLTSPVKLLK